MEINNPHDIFFKEIFSDKENAIDLIKNILPKKAEKNFNFETLKLSNCSFTDEELKETFSDLVYTCKYKNVEEITISFLLEHKSQLPKIPYIQLLTYILNIWKAELKQKKEIRPIIPIIVYHGKKKWEYKPFISYFNGIDDFLSGFIPSFDYIKVDLSAYSDEELKTRIFQKIMTKITLSIFKNIHNEEKIFNNLGDILKLGILYYQEEEGLKFLEKVIRYLMSATNLKNETIIEKIKNISKEGEKIVMSTAEKLIEEGKKQGIQLGMKEGIQLGKQEGKQEGLQLGKQEGKQEGLQLGEIKGKSEAVKKLLLKGFTDKQVAELLEIDLKIIREAKKDISKS